MLVGNNGQANELLLNEGLGGFTLSTRFPGGNANTRSIEFGDVGMPIEGAKTPDSGRTLHLLLTRSGPRVGTDGDGDLDVVIGNMQDANELLLNDGLGGFTASTSFPGSTTNTYNGLFTQTEAVAFGDVGRPLWGSNPRL